MVKAPAGTKTWIIWSALDWRVAPASGVAVPGGAGVALGGAAVVARGTAVGARVAGWVTAALCVAVGALRLGAPVGVTTATVAVGFAGVGVAARGPYSEMAVKMNRPT